MRIKKKTPGIVEGDLTPMIDMTFQLIAFFMVLINFSKVEQSQSIQLPESELAKPPTVPYQDPITLQVLRDGHVILRGQTLSIDDLKPKLVVERSLLESQGIKVPDITLIIRADGRVETDYVQELIEVCQDAKFVTFALRAKTSEKSSGGV